MAGGISLGSAYFELHASSDQLIQEMAKAEAASKKSVAAISQATGIAEKDVARYGAALIRETQKTTAAVEQAAARQAAAAQKASGGFGDLTKGALAFGVAAAGVTLGAAGLHTAIAGIAEATDKAMTAQRQMTAIFGPSAGQWKAYADALAASTGRVNAEVETGVARIGSLQQSYALSNKEVQALSKASLNLAAVFGGDVQEAFRSVQAAVRGEAEASEKYSIFLQDSSIKTTKAFQELTQAQQRGWETLNELTKARVRAQAVLEQAAKFEGAAEDRANSQRGAFDKLSRSVNALAISLGEDFLPAASKTASALDEWLDRLNKIHQRNKDIQEQGGGFRAPFQPDWDVPSDPRLEALRPPSSGSGLSPDTMAGLRSAYPRGYVEGQAEDAARAEEERSRKRREANRKDEVKVALIAADKANDATAESAIRAIDKERKAKERWYDEEKSRIEARRTYALEDIEARKDAELKALEEKKRAELDRLKVAIEAAEREKKLRLEVAEEAKRQALAAIDARSKKNDRDRELEDRETGDTRKRQDRVLADFRQQADHDHEADHEKELKRIEARHTAAIKAIEQEADKARSGSEARLRDLDRQAQKEDDRHRKRMDGLQREADKQISIIQDQIDAIDALSRAEDNADRTADLQKAATEAQAAATRAKGSGTPGQVAGARSDLTAALRGGDEVSIANARERLVQLAGQGVEAIKKADEDLAKAQKALRDEGVKQDRDAQKEILKGRQDAIKGELDAAKRAEDEKTRARKRDIDADKQAEQDRLKAVLAGLDRRKERETQDQKDRIEQRRQEYDDATGRIQSFRRDQDRLLDDGREREDRDRADRRKAEDDALDVQRTAVTKAYEDEQASAEAAYNGPNGLITKLKKASEDTEREYSRQIAVARAAFEQERKDAERLFHNPEGNGYLDELEKARVKEIEKLDASKADWQLWQKQASESIKKAMEDLDAFIKRGANIPNLSRNGGGVNNNISNPNEDAVEKFIKNVAPQYGVSGTDALAVWSGEGKSAYVGDSGSSFGPYQLHYGGIAGGGNSGSGLGEAFTRDTGLDARDPSTWEAQILWVMGYVQRYGWNNQWHGAPADVRNKRYAAGGWIDEPVVGRGLRTGSAYTLGEAGPEYVSPASRMHGSASLLGSGPPMPDYARMGAAMLAAHPGGSVGTVINEGSVHVSGIGLGEVAAEIERRQHRQRLLRGRVGR